MTYISMSQSLVECCYELLVGQPPFESSTDKVTYKGNITVDLRFLESVPLGAQDLISKLLR